MKGGDPFFQCADGDGFHYPGFDAALAQRSRPEVLGREGPAVEQCPASFPMRFRFRRPGRLRDQHEILDQAGADRLRHDHQQVDVVRTDDQYRGWKEGISIGEDAPDGRPVFPVDFRQIVGTPDDGA